MTNSESLIVGNDGEFLTPHEVAPYHPVLEERNGFWYAISGIIVICCTYLFRIVIPSDITIINIGMAFGAIIFQILLVVAIQTSIPIVREKRTSPGDRPNQKIPPHVILINTRSTSVVPNSQNTFAPVNTGCNIVLAGTMMVISWVLLFHVATQTNETLAIYTQGIPVNASVIQGCHMEKTSNDWAYYRTIQYRSILASSTAPLYSGKYYLNQNACVNLPSDTQVVVHYLSASPEQHRIVSREYETYGLDILKQAIDADTLNAGAGWLLFCLLASLPAIWLGRLIFTIRKAAFISEHGEIVLANIVDSSMSTMPNETKGSLDGNISFTFLVRHSDETTLIGHGEYWVFTSGTERHVKPGDKIALLYYNDDFYRVL